MGACSLNSCRGRRPRRPKSGRRRSHPCCARPARARLSGQRLQAQRRCESTALNPGIWFAWQKIFHISGTPAAQRIPKPWVLAAFFGYFLPLLAESAPPETKQGVQCAGTADCHSQCAHWLRNDIFFARGACGIGRRFGYSCPPSRQPIPGHYRGRQSGRLLEIASLLPPPAALRLFLPTVAPTDSRPLPWPPIGAPPRNSLASSATGGASAISPRRSGRRCWPPDPPGCFCPSARPGRKGPPRHR